MSDPLRSLADAARAVTAAATDEDVLEIVAQAARDVIGARHGVARRGRNGAPTGPRLVAPLVARDGSSLGMIELWDKDGEFTPDDEAIVIQLAQMAANAIETLELLAREHAARVEAEETGRRLLREKQRAEALHRVGSAIAGRLELREIVQLATDAARELTPASFGAFFYNVVSDAGEAYMPRATSPAGSSSATPSRACSPPTTSALQRALLPPHLPQISGLELAAGYRAAGEGNEVGGDFYDVFPQGDGSWALVVGDVCGKGPQAAAVTALARYTLRAHAVAGLRPSYMLARLNDALLRQRAPGFVTVALAPAHRRRRRHDRGRAARGGRPRAPERARRRAGLRAAGPAGQRARGPGRVGTVPRRPLRAALGERARGAPPRVARTGA